jgi:hypothetical protein
MEESTVRENLADWRNLADMVARSLGNPDLEHLVQDPAQQKRVLHYYLPVYFWVRQKVTERRETGAKGPCVVRMLAAVLMLRTLCGCCH